MRSVYVSVAVPSWGWTIGRDFHPGPSIERCSSFSTPLDIRLSDRSKRWSRNEAIGVSKTVPRTVTLHPCALRIRTDIPNAGIEFSQSNNRASSEAICIYIYIYIYICIDNRLPARYFSSCTRNASRNRIVHRRRDRWTSDRQISLRFPSTARSIDRSIEDHCCWWEATAPSAFHANSDFLQIRFLRLV